MNDVHLYGAVAKAGKAQVRNTWITGSNPVCAYIGRHFPRTFHGLLSASVTVGGSFCEAECPVEGLPHVFVGMWTSGLSRLYPGRGDRRFESSHPSFLMLCQSTAFQNCGMSSVYNTLSIFSVYLGQVSNLGINIAIYCIFIF